MTFDFFVNNFEKYTEKEIPRLQGGIVGEHFYYVVAKTGKCSSDVFHARLLYNRRSQEYYSHPRGYLRFSIDGVHDFDIQSNTLEIPRIQTYANGIYRSIPRFRALILRTPTADSERELLLKRFSGRTSHEIEVRRLITSLETLTIAADLLQEQYLRAKPLQFGVLTRDPVARLERYLGLVSDSEVSDLKPVLSDPPSLAARRVG